MHRGTSAQDAPEEGVYAPLGQLLDVLTDGGKPGQKVLPRRNAVVAHHGDVSGDLPAGTVAGEEGKIGICVSWRDRKPFERTLLLVPRVVHVGIGCRRGVSKERIAAAVEKVLVENQVHPQAVKCAASIDLKREEEGLLAFCEERGWPAAFYSAGELTAVEGEFTASERVLRVTGVDNVCERAAMVGAERLISGKTVCEGVTAALAVEGWTARF